MKTLFIMRHAKSSWDDASLSDFERPLNGRGLKAAPFMGELMRKKVFRPSIILSSPAMRAKQTSELVKESSGLAVGIKFDRHIYEASPQALRHAIAELDDAFTSAMLVGHNPGIEGFIRFLTGQIEPMPTAALAVIELDIENWSNIDHSCGVLKSVFRPKDEMA